MTLPLAFDAAAAPPGGTGALLDVREVTLENGLTLLFLPDKAVPVFTIMLWVPAGGRTEAVGESGISHYLEHCYSLGSKKLAPREIDRLVQRLGGQKNAFTDLDYTAYFESLPSAALARIIEVEADRFAHLALPEDRLKSELEVVKEERRLRSENSVAGTLHERLMASAFAHHPYGRPVIGTPADLADMTREKVAAYYRRHYVPRNAAYVVVGDFEPEMAIELFQQELGQLPPGERPAIEAPEEPPVALETRVTLHKEGAQLPHLAIAWRGVTIDDPDAPAASLLEVVLAHGDSTPLERILRREKELVLEQSLDVWTMRDPGPITYRAEARPGVTLEAIEAALDEILARAREHACSQDELARAKKRVELAFLSGLESTSARARAIGRWQVTSRRGWRGLLDFLPAVRKLVPEDLRRAAARLLVPHARTVAHLYPGSGPA